MTSATGTVYLVTGATRGIGFGLVEHILEKHTDAFVYAGARDPSKATALKDITQKYPGRVIILKCVSADQEDADELAKAVKSRHGRVDTVIANAGFAHMTHTASTTPIKSFEEHFVVNALGPVVLFQALHDLLKASPRPRFIPISSGAGSIGGMAGIPIHIAAYGSSKAALNHITRKIHFENEWLTAFPLSPGPVETDALNEQRNNDESGVLKAILEKRTLLTPQQAAVSLMKIIDESEREKEGGEFVNIDGSKVPW